MPGISRLKLAATAAVVAAGILAPLYGDPRKAPVTHAEWARLLLRAVELERAASTGQASSVFSALSWKNSLSYRADRFVRADGVRVVAGAGGPQVQSGEIVGEVAYPLAVARGGDYKLRVRLQGNPSTPASAEITALGESAPKGSFVVVPAAASGWVDAGATHLDPGVYEAVLLLPPGTTLQEIEVAPPCLSAIEPPGGWRATAVATAADVAVTALQALDQESDLPPADLPIEASAESFVTTTPAASGAPGSLQAGPQGLQAMVVLDIPEDGLYTVSSFGSDGAGQSWLADACRKAVLCGASAAAPRAPQWRAVMTTRFTAGRHLLRATLASGASVSRLRAERKKDAPADYVATLKRLGFDVGPEGPIARAKAVDAMRFIQGARRQVLSGPCGDVQVPALMTAQAQSGSAEPPSAPGGTTPPFVGAGQPPIGTPQVPVPPPTPPPVVTTPPPVGPSPSPSPVVSPTPGPSPTPTPSPTLSPPPPASPVSPVPGPEPHPLR